MIKVSPIKAFSDNYIWLLENTENKECAVVDPGDAAPVLPYLKAHQLSLSDILLTHHHHDHVGGVEALCKAFSPTVYGPRNENLPQCDIPLGENDEITLAALDLTFKVFEIPGHTLGHIAYIGESGLFCGDTLFLAGCGRLFEGTPAQMLGSLSKLANLPESTLVYCAHEYTETNLEFAKTLEPDNKDLVARLDEVKKLRAQNKPTIPATLEIEMRTNPFLRCDKASLQKAVSKIAGNTLTDPLEVFTIIRKLKDAF